MSSVFTKTPKGTRVLPQCATALPDNECRVLALINGRFGVEDIRARLPLMPEKAFQATLKFLLAAGYIRETTEAHPNSTNVPSDGLGVTELDTEEGVKQWAAAARAAEQLQTHGYYINQEENVRCDGPLQVLLIDDDATMGEAVSLVLGSAGFKVSVLLDSRQALDKIRSMPCLALVLLDVMMPYENGFEVLRRLRGQMDLRKMPVVMLTSQTEREYVLEGLRDGADGYILKPFKPEKLIVYLRDILEAL